jgi:hypothetical protein
MTDVPAGHRFGGAVLVRSTRAGASHGLTDHLPARRGLLDRVRLERVSAHRDPRHHGRAMSAFRPGAWALHPHVRSPSHTASEGTAWPNGAPHGRKRRPRKPVPRPAGWHLGGVGLAQADQVRGDGALRSGLPAGMLRAGDCRRRPRNPWSSKCAGQIYVVGAGGVEPPSSSVSGGSGQLAAPRPAPGCSVLPQLNGGIA